MVDKKPEKKIENRIELEREDYVVDLGEELSDEELDAVAGGGVRVGGTITLCGASLYSDSYGGGYAGKIDGTYQIQRIITGKAAPYLLSYNVGWVKKNNHIVAVDGAPVNFE